MALNESCEVFFVQWISFYFCYDERMDVLRWGQLMLKRKPLEPCWED